MTACALFHYNQLLLSLNATIALPLLPPDRWQWVLGDTCVHLPLLPPPHIPVITLFPGVFDLSYLCVSQAPIWSVPIPGDILYIPLTGCSQNCPQHPYPLPATCQATPSTPTYSMLPAEPPPAPPPAPHYLLSHHQHPQLLHATCQAAFPFLYNSHQPLHLKRTGDHFTLYLSA